MEDRRAPTLGSIAAALLDHVAEEVRVDLRSEDSASAVELYFGPIGCQALPNASITRGSCSIDGYYTADVDPRQPWIFYADDVHEDRARFTILHELGHHLVVTVAAAVLDDIDTVGAKTGSGAIQTEEAVCHRFAGNLLVPDELLHDTIGSDRVTPDHVLTVHERGAASWEAVAVRVAEVMPVAGAVVLLRDGATVGFCAASSRMGRHGGLGKVDLIQTGRWLAVSMCDRPPNRSSTGSGSDTQGPCSATHCRSTEVWQSGCSVTSRATAACRSSMSRNRPGRTADSSANGTRAWSGTSVGATSARVSGAQSVDAAAAAIRCRIRCAAECGLIKPTRTGAAMCRDCEADLG